MSGFYIGVDGKARKVKGGYIGVDGKARKLKKGYIGVDGVARLCWVSSPYDPVFANNSWEEIILACQTDDIPETWAIGDQKTMTINGTDYAIDIIGKDHDEYSDGTGKAPLTFQLHECYTSKYAMNSTGSNSGGWSASRMRQTVLPSIMSLMPAEVQSGIREVAKLTCTGPASSPVESASDKLFLLSEIEVFGEVIRSSAGEGSQYSYYANGGQTIKSINGTACDWFLRSPRAQSDNNFCAVTYGGEAKYLQAHGSDGVSFAFCF